LEESLLTLFGFDRSVALTKDEAVFLEKVIQDVEDDYLAKSVLIEDDATNRSLLRGSKINLLLERRRIDLFYILLPGAIV
jgi:hypothetical protein